MRLFLLFLLVPSVFAFDYYADVQLTVLPDGTVTPQGLTNHPLLSEQSQAFTSKRGEHWILNISLPEQFSDYIVTLTLPPGASMTYAHGESLQISTQDDQVVLKTIGENERFELIAQYSLEKNAVPHNNSVFFVGGFALLFALLAITFVFARTKRVKKAHTPKLVDGLPARQQQIIRLLEKAGGALTQKQLEDALHIPKSSVSRNVEALRRRGLLEKESLGMSNTVRLAK